MVMFIYASSCFLIPNGNNIQYLETQDFSSPTVLTQIETVGAFCATPLMPQKLVSSIQRIICKKPTWVAKPAVYRKIFSRSNIEQFGVEQGLCSLFVLPFPDISDCCIFYKLSRLYRCGQDLAPAPLQTLRSLPERGLERERRRRTTGS